MAGQLVDLAYTKAELKEEKAEGAISPGGQPSPYPWGLSLRLDDSCISKLGIDPLPMVGDEFHMMVIAKVTSVSQSATEGADAETSIGLQICMAQVLMRESAAEEKAEGTDTPAKEAKESKTIMQRY